MNSNKGLTRFIVAACLVASIGLLAAAFWVTSRQFETLPALVLVGGNLHPVLLHLPIGIFVYVIFAEVINIGIGFTRSTWRVTNLRLALGLGVLTSFLAATFGLLLFMQGDYAGDLIRNHLWWGVGFAICSSVVFILSLLMGEASRLYRVVLFACVAIMSIAGHYGGLITHGDPLSPLRAEAPKEIRVEEPFETVLVYEDIVSIIFEAKCYSCHSEAKKKRGGLLMDSYDALLAGGKTDAALVPGSLEDSLISTYVHLPEDDDLHMPPEGKPQLTEEEIRFIDAWIASGAAQSTKVVDSGFSEDLLEWARVYMSEASQAAAEEAEAAAAAPESESKTESESGATEQPLPAEAKVPDVSLQLIAKIQEIEGALGSSVSRYGPEGDVLAFSAVNFRKAMDDAALPKLKPILPYLVDLDLSQTAISSQAIVEILGEAPKLNRINLSQTDVDDSLLEERLEVLNSVEHLILFGTQLTGESVEPLSRMTQLKSLYLGNTSLTENDFEVLREKLPETRIIGGLEL